MRNVFGMAMVLQNSVGQAKIFGEWVFWAEKSIQVGYISG